MLSHDPVRTCLPSGEKVTLRTMPPWIQVCSVLPVTASRRTAVLSAEPVSTWLPSGEKAPLLTKLLWFHVCRVLPVFTSRRTAVLSAEPVSTIFPSGEKATILTEWVCFQTNFSSVTFDRAAFQKKTPEWCPRSALPVLVVLVVRSLPQAAQENIKKKIGSRRIAVAWNDYGVGIRCQLWKM